MLSSAESPAVGQHSAARKRYARIPEVLPVPNLIEHDTTLEARRDRGRHGGADGPDHNKECDREEQRSPAFAVTAANFGAAHGVLTLILRCF